MTFGVLTHIFSNTIVCTEITVMAPNYPKVVTYVKYILFFRNFLITLSFKNVIERLELTMLKILRSSILVFEKRVFDSMRYQL